MNERHEKTFDLFQRACDLPEAEVVGFLEEACGADEQLYADVVELLAADRIAATSETLETERPIPDRIGPYRVIEEVGEGGMGIVVLAEHGEVRHRVALKIIKPGMDTRAVVRRFEAERQALSLMEHPNIAKVFDAGTTEQGLPYFAMEFVDGEPVTDHCDRNALDVEQRLHLFLDICDAVQHAHQKGVIHRDLKRSNVLVAKENGRPRPKVIDFGIAKALHEPLIEGTVVTEQGQIVGTPEYMSPEQADSASEDIDTRSDIYSLGVVLYELLVGQLPFERETLRRAGMEGLPRILREIEPDKPSTRIKDSTDETTTAARNRRVDRGALQRRLRGDLDWITMKALEKDRTRRYATASDLAADIRRHLAHEPVLAGPPSTMYRFTKFVRRNRVAAAMVASLAIIIAGGIIATATQAARAMREASSAKAINAFFNDMLASVDPMQLRLFSGFGPPSYEPTAVLEGGFGRDVTVAEMLRKARYSIDAQETVFPDRPELEASARETLGMTFQSLWLYDEARDQLWKALHIRLHALPEGHPDTLRSMLHFGYTIWRAQRGEHVEAEGWARAAHSGMERLYGEYDARTLTASRLLANTLSGQRRFEESEPLFVETYEKQCQVVGPEHRDTLMTLADWARSLYWQGRENRAWEICCTRHDTCRDALEPEDGLSIEAQANFAFLTITRGDAKEGKPLLREAHDRACEYLGMDHPYTLYVKRYLGQFLESPSERVEREDLLQAAANGMEALGEHNEEMVFTLYHLALHDSLMGRMDEAAERMDRALQALCGSSRGEDHMLSRMMLNQVVVQLELAGRSAEADGRRERLEELSRRVADRAETSVLDLHFTAGVLLSSADERDQREGLRLAERALDLSEGPELQSSKTGYVLDMLAHAHRVNGNHAEARLVTFQRIDHLRAVAARPDACADVLRDYAETLLTAQPPDLRNPAEALIAARRAAGINDEDRTILDTLALAYWMTGDLPRAIEHQARATALLWPGQSRERAESLGKLSGMALQLFFFLAE